MMNKFYNFYSHGKLLITGEYLVLFGAKALAIPVKFGQSLNVREVPESSSFVWNAKEMGKNWFSAKLTLIDLEIITSTNQKIALRLIQLLRAARELNPKFLSIPVHVETNTNFPRKWGLGTSSTLTANIASWAGVDPFQLHWKVSSGSGYDVACALSSSPIIYQLNDKIPSIVPIAFAPSFSDNIYFVYLEKKQDSAKSIAAFNNSEHSLDESIQMISEITETIHVTQDFPLFLELLDRHEIILSEILHQPAIKQVLFPDFPGVIKSLGAWGGDFVLAASSSPEGDVFAYFESRGFQTILKYSQMVIMSGLFLILLF